MFGVRFQLFWVVVFCGIAGAVFAAGPTSFHQVEGLVEVSGPMEGRAVLLDQPLSADNQNAYADQDFEAANDGYDIFVADDFTVPAEGWSITEMTALNATWNPGGDLTCATTLNFIVYADGGGIPDGYPGGGNAPVWSLSVAPGDAQVTLSAGTDGFLSTAQVVLSTPFSLAAGTYWLLFYPEMNFDPCGQSGRQLSDTTNGAAAMVINPGGGFGFPTTWTSIQDPSTWGATEQDLQMQIVGTVLPVELQSLLVE
jgi:hypothetical protein